MLKHLEEYLLRIAMATVKDFLDYAQPGGGEVMLGYVNEYGQELDDCVQITDDMGDAVFLIFVDDLNAGTFHGVMTKDHKAPGTFDNVRHKYTKVGTSPVDLCRWALGI
jgi:hypothetical protein